MVVVVVEVGEGFEHFNCNFYLTISIVGPLKAPLEAVSKIPKIPKILSG